MFRIVPIPGVWRRGIQRSRIKELIMKVENPIIKLVTFVKPCANTVQGLTPALDATSNASPNPKISRPPISINTESRGGFIVRGLGELQKRVGTDFIFRNCIAKLMMSGFIVLLTV